MMVERSFGGRRELNVHFCVGVGNRGWFGFRPAGGFGRVWGVSGVGFVCFFIGL